jgi:hypothetical protein
MSDITTLLAEAIETHTCPDSVAMVADGRGRLTYCWPAILATPAGQTLARQAAIGAAVERVGLTPAETVRGYMRKYGFAFDRWPPDGGRPVDRMDEFDAETRWQGFAFSLYSDFVEYESAIAAALGDEP